MEKWRRKMFANEMVNEAFQLAGFKQGNDSDFDELSEQISGDQGGAEKNHDILEEKIGLLFSLFYELKRSNDLIGIKFCANRIRELFTIIHGLSDAPGFKKEVYRALKTFEFVNSIGILNKKFIASILSSSTDSFYDLLNNEFFKIMERIEEKNYEIISVSGKKDVVRKRFELIVESSNEMLIMIADSRNKFHTIDRINKIKSKAYKIGELHKAK